MADDGEQSIWCRVEVSPLGTYMLVITYDDDNVLSLGRDELLEYVATMAEAGMRAQYAEGVRRQLREILRKRPGAGPKAERYVIETVAELRGEWPELRRFPPYEIHDVVSFEGRTSVQIWRAGEVIAQLAPSNVDEHIAHALRVYAGADLDASYRRYLVGVIGIEDGRARAAVHTLGQHLREE